MEHRMQGPPLGGQKLLAPENVTCVLSKTHNCRKKKDVSHFLQFI